MKPNWKSLLDEKSLASVLPDEHASLALPVRDALAVFLGGLPAAEQAILLQRQAALPPTATMSERLGTLAKNSPVLQKIGQVLARDQRLPLPLRQQLRQLESVAPTVPEKTIRETLTRELGSLDERGVQLAPAAVAEASVAVVIPFRQHGQGVTEGVFKILKPHIEERLEVELQLLDRVGEYLDQRCDELSIPHLDYRDSFQQVREKLSDEVRLDNEQRHLIQAKAFFADEPRVHIPQLLDHNSPRVTSMERLSGGKVTSHGLESGRLKRQLAGTIARSLVAKPIFSGAPAALFHGDPHAGNLFLTDEGRLGILDWSLVGTLGVNERIAMAQVALGAITLDSQRIATVLERLGSRRRPDAVALRAVVGRWVRKIRRGQFPGLTWLIGILDDATQTARLRVNANLMLFRKSLHTLEGVVAEVGEARQQIDRALLGEFVRHFAYEWPQRWWRWPHSRNCATRLSNFDLAGACWTSPAVAGRFWTGHLLDFLNACGGRPAGRNSS